MLVVGFYFMCSSQALELSAHAVLVLDLVLFFVCLIVTSIELVKGMVGET